MRARLANGCLLLKHNRHGPSKTEMSRLLWKTNRGTGLAIHTSPVYTPHSCLVYKTQVEQTPNRGAAIRQDTTQLPQLEKIFTHSVTSQVRSQVSQDTAGRCGAVDRAVLLGAQNCVAFSKARASL